MRGSRDCDIDVDVQGAVSCLKNVAGVALHGGL